MRIRYSRLCCDVDEEEYTIGIICREGLLRMKLSQKAWHQIVDKYSWDEGVVV